LKFLTTVLACLFLFLPLQAAEAKTSKYQELHAIIRASGNLIPQIQNASRHDQDQMLCLALNIYHEIRGGSARDQWAVSHVTVNRTRRRAFNAPTICQVVWAPGQFSWTRKPIPALIPREKAAWVESQRKAALLLSGDGAVDPTGGATHFNTSLSAPWARNLVNRVRIGAHWFARLPGNG